ncbi:glycosyltransferase family 4 protein [Nocardioides campestrisoli]|uniref:glycosyltransferase family 4 protein n=1 Tax=Nocardioides campestrisoli TaxID=2736757 RepID=UPI001CD7314C
MVRDASWEPVVFVPRGVGVPGVFAQEAEKGCLRASGPRHQARSLTNLPRVIEPLAMGAKIVLSAVLLCASREFRRADVVHANTSRSAVYGAVAAWLTRKPLVVHLRDRVDRESLGSFGERALSWILKHRAEGVIANSDATLRTAERHIRRPAACETIWSHTGTAIADDAYPTVADLRRLEAGSRITVGMVARLDPWKGQEVLLRAVSLLPSDIRRKIAVVLVGGTSFGHAGFEGELRKLSSELGVADIVEFTGHVEDVVQHIDQFDICVQCSTRPEPLGQNVLQYLARGRPIVVADEGGPRELVTEGVSGSLFASRQPQSLADSLRALVETSSLRRSLASGALASMRGASDQELSSRYARFFAMIALGVSREL